MIIAVVVIMIIAILLILVVLVQNSKGGGISSNIGISNQVMGVQRSTENIEKITWGLVGGLAVACILSGFFFNNKTISGGPQYEGYKPRTQFELPQNPQMDQGMGQPGGQQGGQPGGGTGQQQPTN